MAIQHRERGNDPRGFPPKKKSRARKLESFCVWLIFIGGCSGTILYLIGNTGDSWISVSGKVVDPQGQPIAGAYLQAFVKPKTEPVDTCTSMEASEYAGNYIVGYGFGGFPRQKVILELIVEKEGYQTYREKFDESQAFYLNHTIVMQPAAP